MSTRNDEPSWTARCNSCVRCAVCARMPSVFCGCECIISHQRKPQPRCQRPPARWRASGRALTFQPCLRAPSDGGARSAHGCNPKRHQVTAPAVCARRYHECAKISRMYGKPRAIPAATCVRVTGRVSLPSSHTGPRGPCIVSVCPSCTPPTTGVASPYRQIACVPRHSHFITRTEWCTPPPALIGQVLEAGTD